MESHGVGSHYTLISYAAFGNVVNFFVPQLSYLYFELNTGYHLFHWDIEIINSLVFISS